MNCSDAHYLAPLYWSRELDQEVEKDLEAHLELCAACSYEFHEQGEFDEILKGAFSFEEVSGLRDRVRAAIGLLDQHHKGILAARGLRWGVVTRS